MNSQSGKSTFLSPFSLLGLCLQLPRQGNHTERENVPLLPICTHRQKASHTASLPVTILVVLGLVRVWEMPWGQGCPVDTAFPGTSLLCPRAEGIIPKKYFLLLTPTSCKSE